MDLNEIAAFAGVLREGSFTRAATVLGVPKSTLSERVTRLESQLGVRLLERTTRSLKPTPEGAAYFERVAQLVSDLDEASAAVAASHRAARGLIRIGSPTLFARMFLLDVIDDFMRDHPDVEVDLVAADRPFQILEEGLDVAIAVSVGPENLVVTKLATANRLPVASRDYVARHGAPREPADLMSHAIVLPTNLTSPGRRASWTFVSPDAPEAPTTLSLRGRLVVSSIDLALQAVLRGAGVTTAPAFLCQAEIDSGRLVRLLPRWTMPGNDLLLLHGATRDLPVRVKIFLEHMLNRFHAGPRILGLERANDRPRRRR
jgi:DNA-binding transcriptional LysR family regulator